MIYVEYEQLRARFREAQNDFYLLLAEKEDLFRKTQPQAVRVDRERVKGGKETDRFGEYLVEKEKKRIDERLEEIKAILEERKALLGEKEKELRGSPEIEDKIYILRYLERLSVAKIAKIVNYSGSQVFRILQKIEPFRKRCE